MKKAVETDGLSLKQLSVSYCFTNFTCFLEVPCATSM